MKVYIAIALVKYIELTLSWYGGETQMLLEVGEETKVRLQLTTRISRTYYYSAFNVPLQVSYRAIPCCCICCCPSKTLTKGRIQFFKACVYQMPYVQAATIFVMIVCTIGMRVPTRN